MAEKSDDTPDSIVNGFADFAGDNTYQPPTTLNTTNIHNNIQCFEVF